ncbi:hypothetical protein [Herbaspirillum camelliae]|uniref:hypothetical protein n=1 Tax=Herbaspirillum camelliae TaxID=1892903 RepID=UPI001300F094|nr:hypothetical protein [Herbaspirillum camelliae]
MTFISRIFRALNTPGHVSIPSVRRQTQFAGRSLLVVVDLADGHEVSLPTEVTVRLN